MCGEFQERMTACNKDAASRNLSGKPPMTQQERMTYCNKEAGAGKLSGDALKAFMSDCLKKK